MPCQCDRQSGFSFHNTSSFKIGLKDLMNRIGNSYNEYKRFLNKCNRLHTFFNANECLENVTICVYGVNIYATDCKKCHKNCIIFVIILVIDNNL